MIAVLLFLLALYLLRRWIALIMLIAVVRVIILGHG